MTERSTAARRDGPDPSRRVPPWATALALAVVGAAGLLVVLLAGRAGPLVAHPPEVELPTLSPPTISAPTRPPMPTGTKQELSEPSGTWLWWVAAVLGALIVLAAVLWLIRMLRQPARVVAPPVSDAGTPAAPPALSALGDDDEIDIGDDRTFDPLRAADDIIACWTALEHGAAEIGCPRRTASTPTEFLDSVTARLGDADLDAAAEGAARTLLGHAPAAPAWTAATALLRLYHRARFDSAALAPGAVALARRSARALLEHWHVRRHLVTDVPESEDVPRPGRHR